MIPLLKETSELSKIIFLSESPINSIGDRDSISPFFSNLIFTPGSAFNV